MTDAPKSNSFDTANGRINWYEWGEASADRPSLLMVHATGFHGRCWDRIIAALPEGLHIIAPDLRGHGQSYKPASLGDWNESADEVGALVAGICPRPVYAIGHSQGGYIIAQLATVRPDAFARLLLVDPVLLSSDMLAAREQMIGINPADHPVARRRNQWESSSQMAARLSAKPPFDRWVRQVMDDYCDYGLVPSSEGDWLELACPPILEASAYLGADRSSPHDKLDRVTCPVTVLRGRDGERKSMVDFSFSPTWPQLASQFPNGTDLQWQDCTHFIPMEQPDRLASLIAEFA
jgi:pimeloyl-ACP methyl ester carboxylesterase